MSLASASVLDVAADGVVRRSRAADVPRIPASVLKTLTFYTARQSVTDGMLSETVTITAADMLGGSSADLQVGDVLTWDALFHGMMLPSGNDAAHAVGRIVGGLLDGTGDAYERFIARMNAVCGEFGWFGAVAASTSGLEQDSRLSAEHVCELLLALDSYAVQVAGTMAYEATISGPNARTVTWEHSIQRDGPVPLPEMVCAKSGTLGGIDLANLAILWDDALGVRHALALLNSWPMSARLHDAREVIDGTILARVHVGGLVPVRNVTRIRHRVGDETREVQSFALGKVEG